MVVAHGQTKILNTSMLQLDTEISDLSKRILHQQNIYRRKYLPEVVKNDFDNAFPVLSNRMKTALGISEPAVRTANAYDLFRTRIIQFSMYW